MFWMIVSIVATPPVWAALDYWRYTHAGWPKRHVIRQVSTNCRKNIAWSVGFLIVLFLYELWSVS